MTRRTSKAGLTFLELLLAVAISGLILSAAATLMFSFARFWKQSEQEPRFEHHVDGVVSFIQYCLDQSEDLSTRVPMSQFGWERPPQQRQPAIWFRLESAPPFFVTELLPVPRIDGWLFLDEDKGLSILWHAPAELTEGRIELHQSLLSPWVEDLEVGYFDADSNTWEYESCADETTRLSRQPPGALRIVFNQNGRKKERSIRMQRHDRHVLVY